MNPIRLDLICLVPSDVTPGSTKLTGPSTGCSCVSCTFVAWGCLGPFTRTQCGLSGPLGLLYSGQVCEWIPRCCSLQSHTGRRRRTVALLTCLRTSFNESLVGLGGDVALICVHCLRWAAFLPLELVTAKAILPKSLHRSV